MLGFFGPLVGAQARTVVLPGGVSCGTCRITVTAGPLLGDDDGDGMFVRRPVTGVRDS